MEEKKDVSTNTTQPKDKEEPNENNYEWLKNEPIVTIGDLKYNYQLTTPQQRKNVFKELIKKMREALKKLNEKKRTEEEHNNEQSR